MCNIYHRCLASFFVAQTKATLQGEFTNKNSVEFDVDGNKIKTFFNSAGTGKNRKILTLFYVTAFFFSMLTVFTLSYNSHVANVNRKMPFWLQVIAQKESPAQNQPL